MTIKSADNTTGTLVLEYVATIRGISKIFEQTITGFQQSDTYSVESLKDIFNESYVQTILKPIGTSISKLTNYYTSQFYADSIANALIVKVSNTLISVLLNELSISEDVLDLKIEIVNIDELKGFLTLRYNLDILGIRVTFDQVLEGFKTDSPDDLALKISENLGFKAFLTTIKGSANSSKLLLTPQKFKDNKFIQIINEEINKIDDYIRNFTGLLDEQFSFKADIINVNDEDGTFNIQYTLNVPRYSKVITQEFSGFRTT